MPRELTEYSIHPKTGNISKGDCWPGCYVTRGWRNALSVQKAIKTGKGAPGTLANAGLREHYDRKIKQLKKEEDSVDRRR